MDMIIHRGIILIIPAKVISVMLRNMYIISLEVRRLLFRGVNVKRQSFPRHERGKRFCSKCNALY